MKRRAFSAGAAEGVRSLHAKRRHLRNRAKAPDPFAWLALITLTIAAQAAHAAEPPPPVLERPTLRCLGTYWILPNDVPSVSVEYRVPGKDEWLKGPPLFRIERGKHLAEKFGSRLDVPESSTLWAGSIVDLAPDTAYDIRLTPQGREPKLLSARTRPEPRLNVNAPMRHVVPGDGGGAGTQADPFKGLAAAQAAAKPGDVFLLHAGVYDGTFDVTKSGDPAKPIVWLGEDAEKVILEGKGVAADKRAPRVISASGLHDVWFERLTIHNADYGVVAHDSARLVVRGCRIHNVDYGIAATRNTRETCVDFFIADNVIEGPSTWPRTKGIENARGVQVTGAGHVVCHNRVRGFADAIDTFNSPRCEAIDVHNNDISEMTDDGVEMDYSQRNVRCFENRFTNVFQGISVQPVFGGPVYVFRNVLHNVEKEPFKIHNSPSGALFYHNTVVKAGPPMLLYTNEPASNLVMRNNLFVGSSGGGSGYVWECSPKMTDCDFDYDGFAAAGYPMFLKWNGKRYATFDEMTTKAPIERHAKLVDAATLFASGAQPPDEARKQQPTPTLTPSQKSAAVDAGQPLPGFNDGFAGAAPDLGAYELDRPVPQYGPRPQPVAYDGRIDPRGLQKAR